METAAEAAAAEVTETAATAALPAADFQAGTYYI